MNDNGYPGQQVPTDTTGQFNATRAVAQALISRMSTCTLVQVVAVTNAGGVSQVGFVDVQPLVNQVDGSNQATPHGILHHLAYFRLQGGTDAVILDPKVGDIGVCVFADHDISSVAASRMQANPGSGRRFDMADGLYFGGVLNGAPVQYVQFTAGGINIVSPGAVAITSASLTHNGKNIGATHEHSGVTAGGSNTGAPV